MDVPIFDSTAVAEPRKPRRLSDVGCMEATLFGGRIGHADDFSQYNKVFKALT